jgi:hypothetical protein
MKEINKRGPWTIALLKRDGTDPCTFLSQYIVIIDTTWKVFALTELPVFGKGKHDHPVVNRSTTFDRCMKILRNFSSPRKNSNEKAVNTPPHPELAEAWN